MSLDRAWALFSAMAFPLAAGSCAACCVVARPARGTAGGRIAALRPGEAAATRTLLPHAKPSRYRRLRPEVAGPWMPRGGDGRPSPLPQGRGGGRIVTALAVWPFQTESG